MDQPDQEHEIRDNRVLGEIDWTVFCGCTRRIVWPAFPVSR